MADLDRAIELAAFASAFLRRGITHHALGR